MSANSDYRELAAFLLRQQSWMVFVTWQACGPEKLDDERRLFENGLDGEAPPALGTQDRASDALPVASLQFVVAPSKMSK